MIETVLVFVCFIDIGAFIVCYLKFDGGYKCFGR